MANSGKDGAALNVGIALNEGMLPNDGGAKPVGNDGIPLGGELELPTDFGTAISDGR